MQNIKKSILVVEDEKPELKALHDKLESAGFNVLSARNGEIGFDVAVQNKPDLILMDIIMPRATGLEMMRKLRASGEYGLHVPVIILTNISTNGYIKAEDVEKCGPAHYLIKADCKIDDVID